MQILKPVVMGKVIAMLYGTAFTNLKASYVGKNFFLYFQASVMVNGIVLKRSNVMFIKV